MKKTNEEIAGRSRAQTLMKMLNDQPESEFPPIPPI